MLRRCNNWDYYSSGIYMITITLANRSMPLLGDVIVDVQSDSPEQIQAHFSPSALGKSVFQKWQELPEFYPQVKPLFLQLMEEHLHGIIQICERMPKPLGSVIGGFKGDCTKAFRTICNATSSLFSPGFQDTILFRQGQLNRMFAYLKDNPRRFAIKRLFPDLFKINRHIPFGTGYLSGIGNSFLLQYPFFHQIQASRSLSIDSMEFESKKQDMLNAVSSHAAIVSPCISNCEKLLARMAFQMKAPLIVLKNNCFPPLYKPGGEYFDACAEGRLLMLAPSGFGYKAGHRPLTRIEACILNAIAQRICGENAAQINYNGIVPAALDSLVEKALTPN